MTTPISDPVAALRTLAARHEADGRLDEADRLWSEAVASAPEDTTAIDRLIALSHRRGDLGRLAQALLARLNLTPGQAELWNDLGAALERLGQGGSAQAAYRRAATVSPDFTPALLNQAFHAYHKGDYRFAIRLSRRAEASGASPGSARLLAAHCAQNLGQAPQAERAYASALVWDPAEVSAWLGLGTLLLSQAKTSLARTCFSHAVALSPGDPTGLANLGEAQRRHGRFAEAARLSRRACALAPQSAVGCNTLALTCSDLALDEAALPWARRAAALDPQRPDLQVNLGVAFKAVGHFDAAEHAIRAGLSRRPDDADFHLSLATTLLAVGRIEEGLREYEWRHASASSRYDVFALPRWDGRPLADGTLLVWGEQGVGDEIAFIQYLKRAQPLAPRIVVECEPRLRSIFARSFPDIAFVARKSPPDSALFESKIVSQIALCSLPHVLGFSFDDLRSEGPFLTPDPARVEIFAKRLAALPGLKVGIAWRSRITESAVAKRLHMTLPEFAPILLIDGVSPINIQYGDLGTLLADFNAAHPDHAVTVFDDLDLMNDLEDVLALSSQLDLMISTATSSYCLPAAAGVETWQLLARIDYLGFGTDTNPCCPRSRGFIRYPGQSWAGPVADLAQALKRRAGST
jgi:tetratricopeptide (TPR) repeat protein